MADGSQGVLTPAKPLNARKKRQLLESALDRLLGAVDGVLADLDALDGDPDMEPSLGAPEKAIYFGVPDQTHWGAGIDADEREVTCEDEGAQCEDEGVSGALDPDSEPSLGSQESDRGGTIWNLHSSYRDHGDGEGEADGRSRSDIAKARRRYTSPHQNIGPLVPWGSR